MFNKAVTPGNLHTHFQKSMVSFLKNPEFISRDFSMGGNNRNREWQNISMFLWTKGGEVIC